MYLNKHHYTFYLKHLYLLELWPLLLVLTLFRLSLTVASTRLILSQADAGDLIAAFGDVVVRGNFVLGCIIFVIVIIIQFVVITKGAGRVAEVAARFTLDAMPGKQMAIDAALNAGLLDEEEARRRCLHCGACAGAASISSSSASRRRRHPDRGGVPPSMSVLGHRPYRGWKAHQVGHL